MREESEPESVGWFHGFVNFLFWNSFTRIWGMEVQGWEHLPKSGKLIVAFNHRSMIDAILVPVICRVRPAHALAKEELFRNPIAGWFFRATRVIPLNRARADFGSMRSVLSVLKRDGCVVVAPEGTRSKTGVPLRPKPGIAFLAQQSGAPVVPCRIRNSEKFPSFVPIQIQFGPMLHFHGEGGRVPYQQFAEKVMEEIFKL